MMTIDDWIQSALTDDKIVVDLLFRLKQTWPPPQSKPYAAVLPPFRWGHRHRRSKPGSSVKKEREPTRCSPTTPLSWSGGGGSAAAASVSDGYDESSLASDRCRSKGAFANESPTATTNKKSRKKKTFTELKEEESLLIKESIHLNKELASLHVTLKEQRDRSMNLKRIKLDFHLLSANKIGARQVGPIANERDSSPIDHNLPILQRVDAQDNNILPSQSIKIQKHVDSKTSFVLPDLNMTPSEDETVLGTLFSTS